MAASGCGGADGTAAGTVLVKAIFPSRLVKVSGNVVL